MKTILSHANLIDCVEPQVRPDTAVLIEDGRIRAILPSAEVDSSADDAQVIDLKGGYLLPGLWDVHIHPDYLSLDEMPLADQVTLFGHRLAAALTESGIVGLRCAGAHHFMDVAWKRAFDSGQHVGTTARPCPPATAVDFRSPFRARARGRAREGKCWGRTRSAINQSP